MIDSYKWAKMVKKNAPKIQTKINCLQTTENATQINSHIKEPQFKRGSRNVIRIQIEMVSNVNRTKVEFNCKIHTNAQDNRLLKLQDFLKSTQQSFCLTCFEVRTTSTDQFLLP